MKYDEIRVLLSAHEEGRFKVRVSLPDLSLIETDFEPPQGVDAQALYQEWFDSFDPPPSPDRTRVVAERRRKAGEALFQALFASAAPQVLRMLNVFEERLRHQGERPTGLRLRLQLGDALGKSESRAEAILPVSHLPHELMVPPGIPQFLARRRFISIVRTIGVDQTVGPISVSGNLRVLVVCPQPKDATPLEWAKEVKRIKNALEKRPDTTVEVLKKGKASFENTCQRLRDGQFHILHFIGHGGFDANSGQWTLLFEKSGKKQPIVAGRLADQLGEVMTLRLAVLNACRSGELARESGGDPLAGIAARLSAYGVPAVIGMQVKVSDSAAIDFASAFYSALRENVPIETALADARRAIDESSPEWATPVLYLRSGDSELFSFVPSSSGPTVRDEGPPELKLGIRTLVESPQFPLAEWAKRLETTTEKLLPLEESFEGRFIIHPEWWSERVLPRLNRFLSDAVAQDRPLVLSLAAHGTVAFAAGYYFHTKAATKITLIQVTDGSVRWSATEGSCPQGPLWQSFEEEVIDPDAVDVAVAVTIAQKTSDSARTYLAQSGTKVGRLISARMVGELGKARIESGAHAYQLASELQEWLKDNTGNRSQRRLHLFISAPNGFLFFFGQLARSLGPLRLYEYDFEGKKHGTYEPSLDLPHEVSE